MPVYTYRREDGTTFDYRQSFHEDPLTTDPATGQKVIRVVQAAGVIFKGSGFYVTDTRGANKSTMPATDAKTPAKPDAKADTKSESKAETAAPAAAPAPAAAAD
ncbi:MAG: hypothetical protein MUE40_04280 [Anaerolineae bacterium]|jgi:putative FmdB family regulatory protein|nr:hypothetical protein [Anaerolineae bacterium]